MTFRSTVRSGLFLWLLFAMNPAHSAVRAWVDNTSVAADGTVLLTLERDGRTDDEPDLSPVKQDFDILSTSRGTSVRIDNGSVSSHVQLQLSLAPKHSGEIRIPAITWGSDRSEPVTVNVGNGASNNAPAASNGSNASKVFVETAIDTRQPYLQAGVNLTVRLYTAVPLYQASLDLPASNDVLVQQLGADRAETQVKDGQRYQVVERHYVLFPQRSGPLTLPGPVLNAQIAVQDRSSALADPFKDFFGDSPFNGMLASAKPIRVHGDAIALNVLPRPASAVGNYWLPARGLSLVSAWHPDQLRAKVGDPITLELHLKAQDLTAAQLPDLSTLLSLPPGLRAYPDQAKLNNDTHGDELIGTRDQSIALIADQPGQFTVPALTLHWWDTLNNRAQEVTLPEQTLSIAPAPAAASAPPNTLPANAATAVSRASSNHESSAPMMPTPPSNTGEKWKWLSAGFGALWIITLAAWIIAHRRSSPPRSAEPVLNAKVAISPSLSRARSDFQDACCRSDAPAARAALVTWVKAAAPGAQLVGLRAFARQANDPQLSTLLLDLDRACYGGGQWSGAALLEALRELPIRSNEIQKAGEELAPLYR